VKTLKQFFEMDHHKVIAALRAKTVARGATGPEAASAKAKADELEKKHGASIVSTPSDMKQRWANMHADMEKRRAERPAYTKAYTQAKRDPNKKNSAYTQAKRYPSWEARRAAKKAEMDTREREKKQ
jgi:hypothetical protein